jgi:hypothetical protein
MALPCGVKQNPTKITHYSRAMLFLNRYRYLSSVVLIAGSDCFPSNAKARTTDRAF